MSKRSRTCVLALPIAAVLAVAAVPTAVASHGGQPPADTPSGPSDLVVELFECDSGAVIGGVRFRDGAGRRRLVVFGRSQAARDATVFLRFDDVAGLASTFPLTLDGGGGGRFVVTTHADGPQIVPGADAGLDVLDGDGNVVASTNPGDCGEARTDR